MEFLTGLNVIIFLYDAVAFYRKPDSIYLFLKLCFSFIIGVGVLFLQVMVATVGYKFEVRDLEVIQQLFLLGYLALVSGAWVTSKAAGLMMPSTRRAPQFAQGPSARGSKLTQSGLHALALASLFSVAAYVALNGLSFGQGSYEDRYKDAQGMGILLRLFPAFLPYAAYRLVVAKDRSEFIRVAAVAMLFTGFMYIALEGYRQILIAALLITLVIALKRRFLPAPLVAVTALLALPGVIGLSFLRYIGESSAVTFQDPIVAAFYYTQGDLFPIDAPLRTFWWCSARECPGWGPFLNHFTHLIPRAIWPEKPDIQFDAAGYYTQVIIGYYRNVTLSSTIFSEAIMIGGYWAVPMFMFVSGVLAKLFSIWADRATGIMRFILLSNVYIGFFWIREGLENGLLRIIFAVIFLLIALLLAPLVATLPSRTVGHARFKGA
jgi:WzyE protein.